MLPDFREIVLRVAFFAFFLTAQCLAFWLVGRGDGTWFGVVGVACSVVTLVAVVRRGA